MTYEGLRTDSKNVPFVVSGDPGAPQSYRSRMVENVRAVLPQLHQEHLEQHGVEASAVAQHDFHLERSVLFVTLVGKVSNMGTRDRGDWNRVEYMNTNGKNHIHGIREYSEML